MDGVNVGLMQAIRGPVLLITIGVLFSIDHFGSVSFSRTWPVILIIVGVMKLLERAGRPSAPQTPAAWR